MKTHITSMKRGLLAALFGAVLTATVPGSVQAAGPTNVVPDRTRLPNLIVLDETGTRTALSSLGLPEGRLVIAIVDAALPSASRAIDALVFKEASANLPLVVLVVGTDAEFNTTKRRHEKQTQLRWFRVPGRDEVAKADLPGLPLLLGVAEDRSVGFSYSGLPKNRDRISDMVLGWLDTPRTGDAQ